MSRVYCKDMVETTKFKGQLEIMLDDVIVELERIAVYEKTTGDWVAKPDGGEVGEADENVEADVVEAWNERRAVLAQLETRFNNIKRALKKIEDGTFGTCEISAEPIEADRLAANPAARTCKAHMNDEGQLPL